MKKILFTMIVLMSAHVATADVIPPTQQELDKFKKEYDTGCNYKMSYVLKAKGCGTPICFGTVHCGGKDTEVSCLAVNGACPANAQTCYDDPNVEFATPNASQSGSSGTSDQTGGTSVAK